MKFYHKLAAWQVRIFLLCSLSQIASNMTCVWHHNFSIISFRCHSKSYGYFKNMASSVLWISSQETFEWKRLEWNVSNYSKLPPPGGLALLAGWPNPGASPYEGGVGPRFERRLRGGQGFVLLFALPDCNFSGVSGASPCKGEDALILSKISETVK